MPKLRDAAEESQASELLAKLMNKGDKSNRLSGDEEAEDEWGASKELSSNTSLSPNNHQAPHYHLFGLASTQTQSPDDDSCNEQSSSQKENVGSPRPSGRSNVNAAQSSRELGQAKASSNGSQFNDGGISSPAFVKQPLIKGKAGSNQPSCIKANVPPRTAANSPRLLTTRSRSPSVDSFAGPIEDPGGHLVSTARQFNVPLSELANSSEDTSRRDDTEMFVHTFGTSPQRRSQLGRVLVEATPSNSSHSESQSQTDSQESQREVLPFPQEDEIRSQESDIVEAQLPEDISYEELKLASGNSSQESFWNNYDNPTANEPALDATQIDCTQPATQSTQVLDSDALEELGADVSDAEWNRFTASRSTGKPIDIPKHKRARYLDSARQGAAQRVVQEDDFLQDPDSHTNATSEINTTPWSVPPVQYPAGYPSDFGQQTQVYEATQLVDEAGHTQVPTEPATAAGTQVSSEPQANQNFPPIQYPAGLPSNADTGGQETQPLYPSAPVTSSVDEASVVANASVPQETQITSYEQDPVSRRRQLIPPPAHVPANDAFDIVPDSEPPLPATSSPRHVLQEPNTPKAPERLQVDAGNRTDAMEVDETVKPDPEEDDDDVPLGAVARASGQTNERDDVPASEVSSACSKTTSTRSAKSKGKQKATSPLDSDVMLPPLASGKKKGKRSANELTEIPSSIPNEIVVNAKRPNNKGKGKAKAVATSSKTSSKATSMSGSRRQSGRLANKEQRKLIEDSDSEDGFKEEDDTATELPDDDYMDVDDTSRKRKRVPSSTASKKVAKVKAERGFQTPANARTTRSQSTVCSSSKIKLSDTSAFRVLALWPNGYWYAGKVSAVQADTYTIDFDDGSRNYNKAGSIRLLQLKPGDEVFAGPSYNKSAKIVEVHRDELIVSLPGGDIMPLSFARFRISPQEVDLHWKDRSLTSDVLAAIQDKVSFSEATGRLVNADSFLQDCGVIITTSPSLTNWDVLKARIHNTMVKNGITLIEDWSDALQVKGEFDDASSPKRWIIKKDDITWFQDPDELNSLKRVFLLADAPCQKPKYLIALALGVPCLSLKWLTDEFKGRKLDNWSPYLLPQGFIPQYATNVSQFVDLHWGQNTEHLSRIMDNPVASKLFDGLSILCIGSDFIPKVDPDRKTRQGVGSSSLPRTISNRSDMVSSIPLIILAMGARRVEAALSYSDVANAKSTTFDLVVYKDRKSPASNFKSIQHVSWTWVKHSLISGRRLPFEE